MIGTMIPNTNGPIPAPKCYGTIVPSAQAIAIQQSPVDKIGLATSTFYMFADFGAGIGPFV
jgi:hypothetical protein